MFEFNKCLIFKKIVKKYFLRIIWSVLNFNFTFDLMANYKKISDSRVQFVLTIEKSDLDKAQALVEE